LSAVVRGGEIGALPAILSRAGLASASVQSAFSRITYCLELRHECILDLDCLFDAGVIRVAEANRLQKLSPDILMRLGIVEAIGFCLERSNQCGELCG